MTEPITSFAVNPSDFRSQFKKPPVVRRHLTTLLDISVEQFDQHAQRLLEKIKDCRGFTEHTVREHWVFRVDDRNGVPIPKANLTHIPRLERKSVGSTSNAFLELVPPRASQPAKLVIGNMRSDGEPTRFEDLQDEVIASLPILVEGFSLHGVMGMSLKYQNRLAPSRYPGLWEENSRVLLGNMFSMFDTVSGRGHSFIGPLTIEFTERVEKLIDESPLCADAVIEFGTRTSEILEQKEVAFEVDLVYSIPPDTRLLWPEECKGHFEYAHRLILAAFGAYFADKALQEFCKS